jgi:hypothetical protein
MRWRHFRQVGVTLQFSIIYLLLRAQNFIYEGSVERYPGLYVVDGALSKGLPALPIPRSQSPLSPSGAWTTSSGAIGCATECNPDNTKRSF